MHLYKAKLSFAEPTQIPALGKGIPLAVSSKLERQLRSRRLRCIEDGFQLRKRSQNSIIGLQSLRDLPSPL